MRDVVPYENQTEKFGVKIMLISGDFRQLLPVIEKGNRSAIVNHTIKKNLHCGIMLKL